jgi:hypothetical protein
MKTYYIPHLETALSDVKNNPGKWNDNSEKNPIRKSLDLLHDEINHELTKIGGKTKFPEVDLLVPGKFDLKVADSTEHFLKALKNYYTYRSAKANEERNAIVDSLTDNAPEKIAAFTAARMKYLNEEVSNWVENRNSLTKIVPWKGRLVQKVYPIYFDDHRPNNPLDFTANFYTPTKHFIGRKYDTLYFNIAMIWSFTILFYATLYFEVLKKLVHGFELRRRYIWRRKE